MYLLYNHNNINNCTCTERPGLHLRNRTRKQLLTAHPAIQSRAEKKCPAELAMQTIRLLRRRRKALPQHNRDQIPDAVRDSLVAKVVDIW